MKDIGKTWVNTRKEAITTEEKNGIDKLFTQMKFILGMKTLRNKLSDKK